MSDQEPKKDYEVGFKKPPKSTQFTKGKSGNPKGRPKGSKNFATDLKEELAESIPVKEDGKTRKISKQRALIKALTSKGLEKNVPAIAHVFELIDRVLGIDLFEVESTPLAEVDDQIIAAFLERAKAQPEQESKTAPHDEKGKENETDITGEDKES